MPYGNFYYGKVGFHFKKSGAVGNRHNPSLGLICNQPQDVNNRYVPGSGVGASSTAQRRAKLIQSYATTPQICGQSPTRLGLYVKGGSNMYALNWLLNNGCPYNPSIVTPVTPVIPVAPTIYAVITGYTQATVYWSTTDSTITSFTLQYGTDNSTWTTIPNISSALRSYTITGLSNNQQYYFQILATNSLGNSPYSSSISSIVQNFASWDLFPDAYNYASTIIAATYPTTQTDARGDTTLILYRQGYYYSSASSILSQGNINEFYSYMAFQYTNKLDVNPNYNFWNTASARYNAAGNYIGSASTIIQGVGTILGEWMQSITQFNSAINSYNIQGRYSDATVAPTTWYIVGSTDNATWYLITSRTTIYTWGGSYQNNTATFNSPNYPLPFTNSVYNYIRIIVPTIYNSFGTNQALNLWIFRPNALIQNLTPGAPTNLVQTNGTATSITFTFTPGVSYGGAITNYRYSTNGGTTFAFVSSFASNTVTITGLTANTNYNIVLKCVNQYGAGTSSSTYGMSTGTLAPTALLLQSSYRGFIPPTNIVITFTPPSSGSFTIINYQYSIDGGATFTNVSSFTTNTTVRINGLTNNVKYVIYLRTVSNLGQTGTISAPITVIIGDYDNSNLTGTTLQAYNNNATLALTNAGVYSNPTIWYVSGINASNTQFYSQIATITNNSGDSFITTTPSQTFTNGGLYYFYIPSTP